jgi:hypothetical protein
VLQAALVKFSSFDIKEGGKMNTYSQFETVDTAAGQWSHLLPLAAQSRCSSTFTTYGPIISLANAWRQLDMTEPSERSYGALS